MTIKKIKMPTICEIKRCEKCTNYMVEGFIDETLETYYCSDKCLDGAVSKSDQKESFEDETLFWTNWYDDTTVYVIFDNQYATIEDAEFIQSEFGNPTNRITIATYSIHNPVFTIKDSKQIEIEELS